MRLLRSLGRDHRGASSVEYALLITIVAGIIAASVLLFGEAVDSLFALPGWFD